MRKSELSETQAEDSIMPNRSTGCYECRKRKTRCDGLRPWCRRCTLYGVVCPGYKIQRPGDVEFRDETNLTIRRASQAHEGSRKLSLSVLKASTSEKSGEVVALIPSSPLAARLSSVAPKVLHSPAANRIQLYSAFLDAWVPHNILPSERGSSVEAVHIDPFREIIHFAQDSPFLANAMDTLSLISTAGLCREPHFLQAAVESYARALRRLSAAMTASRALANDHILATVVVLGICEFYDVIHTHNSQGWQHHQDGLRMLIEARGPNLYRDCSSPAVLAQAKHSLLVTSILARKRDSLDFAQWRDLSFRLPTAHRFQEYEVALRLPALLERHDNLESSGPSLSNNIDKLIADFGLLTNDLNAQFDGMLTSLSMVKDQYFVSENIDRFSPFSELVSNRTLKQAYRFLSFACAFLHVTYWTRMLHIQTAIYSLIVRREHSAIQEARRSKLQLSNYVSHLCRSIPFLIEPENSLMGHLCCFQPLLGLSKHFIQFENFDWLEWAESVRTSIFSRGLSIPPLRCEESVRSI